MNSIITIAVHTFIWGLIAGKAIATQDILSRTRWGILGVVFGLYTMSLINSQAGTL
jgi:hypothetical protein